MASQRQAKGGVAQRPRLPDARRLRFPGVGAPLVLPPDDGLIAALSSCLSGWLPSAKTGAQGPALALVLPESGGSFTLASRHLDQPLAHLSPTATICGLIADLAQGFCDDLPGGLGLHCAAFRFGPGPLILLTGGHRAGKSTLIAHLALREGVEIFGDDVLPISSSGQAIALGAAPRLRLPLPETLGPTARDRILLADTRYAYLQPLRLAPHGTTARPGLLIALEREEGADPSLHPMPKDQAVALLLRQSITALPEPEQALARAEALVAGMTCLTLRLGCPDTAAGFLAKSFGPGAPLLATNRLPPLPPKARRMRPPAPDQPLVRATGFTLRRIQSGLFLWHPEESMLWHLNGLAHALWLMLDTPATATELAAELSTVFPQTPADQISADLAAFLAEAQENGLIHPA